MENLTGIVANVAGLNGFVKFRNLKTVIRKSRYDIICLFETKWSKNLVVNWSGLDSIYQIKEMRNVTSKLGSVVLIHRRLGNCIVSCEAISDRLIVVTLCLDHKLVNLIAVHWPILPLERKNFELLIRSHLSANDVNVLAGDMNVNCAQKEHQLAHLMLSYDLYDIARLKNFVPSCTRFTKNQKSSRLDRVLVSKWALDQVCLMLTTITKSDHAALKIVFKQRVKNQCIGIIRKNPVVFVPSFFKECAVDYSVLLGDKLLINFLTSTGLLWNLVKEDVRNKGKVLACNYNNDFYEKKYVHEKKRLELKLAGSQLTGVEYFDELGKLDELLIAHDQLILNKLKIVSQNTLLSNRNYLIRRLKNRALKRQIFVLKCDNNIVHTPSKIIKVLEDFYKNLVLAPSGMLQSGSKNFFNQFLKNKPCAIAAGANVGPFSHQNQINLNMDFNQEELQLVVGKLKSQVMPGPDSITAEVYKKSKVISESFLLPWLNDLLNGKVDDDVFAGFNTANMIFIEKKVTAEVTDVNNLRPISVLNLDAKILAILLHNRIKKFFSGMFPPQVSGIKGNPIANCIWMLRLAFQNREDRCNEYPRMCRIDFRKAFDSVNVDYLGELIYKYFGKNKTSDMIIKCIKFKSLRVLIQNFEGTPFKSYHGLLQGSPLSSSLYALYILDLVKVIDKYIWGIKIRRLPQRLKSLSYCDDLTIFCADNNDVINFQRILDSFASHTGSLVNCEKSYLFDLKKNCVIKHWKFSGKEDKILGLFFGKHMDFIRKKHIDEMIDQIIRSVVKAGRLYGNILDRVVAVNTLWIPRLTFVSSVGSFTKKQLRRLSVCFSDFIWRKKRLRMSAPKMSMPRKYGGLGLIDVHVLYKNNCIRSIVRFAFQHIGCSFLDVVKSWGQYDPLVKHILSNMNSLYPDTITVENVGNYKMIINRQLENNCELLYYKNKNVNLNYTKKMNLDSNTINFAVRASLDILPSLQNLVKRRILKDINSECPRCAGKIESLDHLLFECNHLLPIMKIVWNLCGINPPCYIERENIFLRTLYLLKWKYKKFYLVSCKRIWVYRCDRIFGVKPISLQWRDVQCAIETTFMFDFMHRNIPWINKFWPLDSLLVYDGIHDTVLFLKNQLRRCF